MMQRALQHPPTMHKTERKCIYMDITVDKIKKFLAQLACYGFFLLIITSCSHVSSVKLNGMLEENQIEIADKTRHYLTYIPTQLPAHSPLLFVFHGSLGSPEQIRELTDYRFDQLADQQKFVVIYPAGFEHHWNDCRKKATYSAKTQQIDDVRFIRQLIQYFQKKYQIDTKQVYATGYSNGGHMAFRLALEAPDAISAIAAISANLPTAENNDCKIQHKPVSVLILNGTLDPINPYQGGEVTLFGVGSRGHVLSTTASAEWFVNLNHAKPLRTHERLSNSEMFGNVWAEESFWQSRKGHAVEVITIHGGGHTIPIEHHQTISPLGITFGGIDGPKIIWDFFMKISPNNR